MDRTAMRTELKDLGHNYGTTGWDARLDRFLNHAAKEVLHEELWPQRRVASTGITVGAVVPLLGQVKQVRMTVTQAILEPVRVEELRDEWTGPVPTGVPLYYYMQDNTKIQTWPTLAGLTIDIDHLGRGVWFAADLTTRKVESTVDTDSLIGADIFEEAVTVAARIRVLEDSDETDLREALHLRLRGPDGRGGIMGRLRDQELLKDSDEPQRIKQTQPWY